MILIVGCGFLGNHLVKYICSQTDEPVLATVRSFENLLSYDNVEYIECDITVKSDLTKLKEKLSSKSVKVFYFAASHNIDYVYKNPSDARKVNVEGLENFLNLNINIEKLFFASTDCVYGESKFDKTKFSESSVVSPINEYGRQKAEAEEIVIKHGFTVLRFPLLLGPSLTTKQHFYDRICKDLKNNNPIEMIDGMKRSVISYSDAAKFMFLLSCCDENSIPNIINVCGDEIYSKYDIGCILARKTGASVSLVKKISEEQGRSFFLDKRASDIVMDNTLLKSLLGIDEILWEETIC